MEKRPKLRTVEKYTPLYPLGKFPKSFALELGKEVICLLASRGTTRLEGSDWEEIFARVIGAEWKPSNVGLDDIVHEQTAWSAKSVKNPKPSAVSRVRLICGRNSPGYSYGETDVFHSDPNDLGGQILSIWNERVSGIRKLYQHLRTVVLVKSDDLLELAVFEIDTILHRCEDYWWQWNEKKNLEGFKKENNEHLFTWQPHGSQFTIIEAVPENRLALRLKKPPLIDKNTVLDHIHFDPSWVQIID